MPRTYKHRDDALQAAYTAVGKAGLYFHNAHYAKIAEALKVLVALREELDEELVTSSEDAAIAA